MINIAICADKELMEFICAQTEEYIRKEKRTAVIHRYTDSRMLLAECRPKQFDIVFLEPETTHFNGIYTGGVLKEKYPDIILVYVSASMDYALQGYKVNAFRYILKNEQTGAFAEELPAIFNEHRKLNRFFLFRKDGEPIKIMYSDIVYLMSDVRKIILHTKSGTKHSFYAKLNELEEQFAYNGFLRVQRSYMVNLKYAIKLSNYNIYLNDGTVIPTSKNNFQQLKLRYRQIKQRL